MRNEHGLPVRCPWCAKDADVLEALSRCLGYWETCEAHGPPRPKPVNADEDLCGHCQTPRRRHEPCGSFVRPRSESAFATKVRQALGDPLAQRDLFRALLEEASLGREPGDWRARVAEALKR